MVGRALCMDRINHTCNRGRFHHLLNDFVAVHQHCTASFSRPQVLQNQTLEVWDQHSNTYKHWCYRESKNCGHISPSLPTSAHSSLPLCLDAHECDGLIMLEQTLHDVNGFVQVSPHKCAANARLLKSQITRRFGSIGNSKRNCPPRQIMQLPSMYLKLSRPPSSCVDK